MLSKNLQNPHDFLDKDIDKLSSQPEEPLRRTKEKVQPERHHSKHRPPRDEGKNTAI